jgi:hypothetical protein
MGASDVSFGAVDRPPTLVMCALMAEQVDIRRTSTVVVLS